MHGGQRIGVLPFIHDSDQSHAHLCARNVQTCPLYMIQTSHRLICVQEVNKQGARMPFEHQSVGAGAL